MRQPSVRFEGELKLPPGSGACPPHVVTVPTALHGSQHLDQGAVAIYHQAHTVAFLSQGRVLDARIAIKCEKAKTL